DLRVHQHVPGHGAHRARGGVRGHRRLVRDARPRRAVARWPLLQGPEVARGAVRGRRGGGVMSSGIGRDEILGLEAYERSRGYIRRRAIEARGARRVVIGPSASLVFENRETLRYQIQEMLRAERIVDPDAIAHEIETYSELLPRPDELSATLFFEFPDPATRAQELEKMAGVERHVWLVIGEDRIAG